MRVHFIGGPGSGKSFLARKLGEENGIPVLGLDDIFWDRTARQHGVKAEETVRDAALRDFVAQDHWIVEGVYFRWTMASFARADRIIALTTPLWLRQVRIFRRFLRRRFGLEAGQNETWQSFREMAAWNRGYDGDNLVRALALLEEARLPVRCCSSPADFRRALE